MCCTLWPDSATYNLLLSTACLRLVVIVVVYSWLWEGASDGAVWRRNTAKCVKIAEGQVQKHIFVDALAPTHTHKHTRILGFLHF